MHRHRLPVRLRLVVGFASAMFLLLVAVSGFVYWRVEVALDHRLNQDLATQTRDLRQAALHLPPRAALASLRDQGREAQLLRADGSVIVSGSGLTPDVPLLTPAQARQASRVPLQTSRGNLFSPHGKHLRSLALPMAGNHQAAVAASAVRLDQRDEALRELLAQLAIANLVALAIASLVGYRFAQAALGPVERYRAHAERIARGATGVRLDVPVGPPDELTRLGSTLNAMLDALERSAARQQQFIDDASHELRTPLSTLTAEVEIALRKPRTTAEYEATLRRIAADTSNIRDLAETLLTLGALGSTTPGAADVPAARLLDTAARRARAQLVQDDQRTVDVDAATEMSVYGDESLLERALGNIAENAVRHGAGAIRLATQTEADGTVSVLTVHDEGHLDPDFLAAAAERFRQHESSRSGEGAGLGLAVVDAIAAAHVGQLRICSDGHHHKQPAADPLIDSLACTHPHNGTTISLLLPQRRGRPDSPARS